MVRVKVRRVISAEPRNTHRKYSAPSRQIREAQLIFSCAMRNVAHVFVTITTKTTSSAIVSGIRVRRLTVGCKVFGSAVMHCRAPTGRYARLRNHMSRTKLVQCDEEAMM